MKPGKQLIKDSLIFLVEYSFFSKHNTIHPFSSKKHSHPTYSNTDTQQEGGQRMRERERERMRENESYTISYSMCFLDTVCQTAFFLSPCLLFIHPFFWPRLLFIVTIVWVSGTRVSENDIMTSWIERENVFVCLYLNRMCEYIWQGTQKGEEMKEMKR